MFNQILDKAELHRRGPHQMRHTFASLLLQAGVPITYVSQQLGHRDASITLRVYAHWLPDATADRGVDRLDDGATIRNLSATKALRAGAGNPRKWLKRSGEPPRNRTGNLQIKSSIKLHPHTSEAVRTVVFIGFVCPVDAGTFAEVRWLVCQLECHPHSPKNPAEGGLPVWVYAAACPHSEDAAYKDSNLRPPAPSWCCQSGRTQEP